MGVVRRTGVRVYRWRAAWREALALRCAAGSDGPGELPDPLDLLGQDQLVVAGMPQPIALVAVADQQFALALEQPGAFALDGLDRGRPFGGGVVGGGGGVGAAVRGRKRRAGRTPGPARPTWSGSACRCGYAAADSTRCRGGSAVRAGP